MNYKHDEDKVKYWLTSCPQKGNTIGNFTKECKADPTKANYGKMLWKFLEGRFAPEIAKVMELTAKVKELEARLAQVPPVSPVSPSSDY